MPPKIWKCPECLRGFNTPRGLSTHMGMYHKDQYLHEQSAGPRAKRTKGMPDAPPPPPPFPPAEDVGAEEAVGEEPPLDSVDDGDAEAVAVAEARAYARQLLRHSGWEQWAEDTLRWYERNHLADVAALFPAAEDYATPETYRFMQLFHEHPGASFATELLQANQQEPLDLSKVGIWCTFAAHSMTGI